MTKKFEEFEVYQLSIKLAVEIFHFLDDQDFNNEREIKFQLKKASISNNIAEGSEYNNNKQFIRYLKIAKGSTAEVRSILNLIAALNLGNKSKIDELIEKSILISRQLSKFIDYLKIKN